MGWVISISGLDGAGKSTLIDKLIDKYEHTENPLIFFNLRLGFTPLIALLKKWTRTSKTNMPSAVSSECSSSDKRKSLFRRAVWSIYCLGSILDLIGMLIWISILRSVGRRVITERYYWDDEIIYLEKFGSPGWLHRVLFTAARRVAVQPDAAFMLVVVPEESYRRMLERTGGVIEEGLEVLMERANLYTELAPKWLISIDASDPSDQVFEVVCTHLEDLLR